MTPIFTIKDLLLSILNFLFYPSAAISTFLVGGTFIILRCWSLMALSYFCLLFTYSGHPSPVLNPTVTVTMFELRLTQVLKHLFVILGLNYQLVI
jgi:hypothetical protein